MEFTQATFKLLFLFLPGMVVAIIVDKLTKNRREYGVEFLLFSSLYGLISYLTAHVLCVVINWLSCNKLNLGLTFFDSIFQDNLTPNLTEVFFTSIIAVALGLILSKIIQKGTLYKIAKKWGMTVQSGTDSVWESVLKSDEITWITIRDKEKDLLYQGYLEQYSDSFEKAEVFLREVKVYEDSTGAFFYDVDAVYLTLDPDHIIIEVQTLENGEPL